MTLIIIKHPLERHKLVVANVRCQLNRQVFGIEQRPLLVKVRNVHDDLVHPEVLEEDRELVHDHGVASR